MTTVFARPVGENVQLRFAYDPWLISVAKAAPGASLAPGGWLIPVAAFPAFVLAVGASAVKLEDPALASIMPTDPFHACRPSEVLADLRPRCPTWGEANTPYGMTERDYQATGTTFLVTTPAAMLLDEMGLGKSKQVIDAVSYVHRKAFGQRMNVLIVAKASSVSNWRNELEMFSDPCDIQLLRGAVKQRTAQLHAEPTRSLRYFVVSWQTMRNDITALGRLPWEWIVLDEAHLAKSTPLNDNQSLQASAIHSLRAKRKVAMTGTFIVNAAEDSWNVLNWLQIDTRSWETFERETLKTITYERGGKELKMVVGYRPEGLIKLRRLIGSSMVRRTKDEEMPGLPPFIRTTVEVTLNEEETKRYRAVEDESFMYLDTVSSDDGFMVGDSAEVLRLKQVTSSIESMLDRQFVSSKVATALSLVEDLVESGAKVIIGTQFLAVVRSLGRVLAKFNPAIVHGGVSTTCARGFVLSPRDRQIQRFQEDADCHVFIASVAACREAINLTAASAIIHIDTEWSKAYVDQFEARARRIGSERHKAINVYSLFAKLPPSKRHPNGEETIDYGIAALLAKKERLANSLTGAAGERVGDKTNDNERTRGVLQPPSAGIA